MGAGKPMGFATWVWQVQVQCQICQPALTPHPSWETCKSQPLSQLLIAQSLFFFAHTLTLALSLPCTLTIAPVPSLIPHHHHLHPHMPPPLPSPSPSHTVTLVHAASLMHAASLVQSCTHRCPHAASCMCRGQSFIILCSYNS